MTEARQRESWWHTAMLKAIWTDGKLVNPFDRQAASPAKRPSIAPTESVNIIAGLMGLGAHANG